MQCADIGGRAADINDNRLLEVREERRTAHRIGRTGGDGQHREAFGKLGAHQRAVVLRQVKRGRDASPRERLTEGPHRLVSEVVQTGVEDRGVLALEQSDATDLARDGDLGIGMNFFDDRGGAGFDAGRVVFPGRVDYATYIRLLQRSDAHVYLTYPFVASWSLREAIATGCAVIGSDTAPVREFITHGRTGLLTPFHDPRGIADSVLRVLEDLRLARRLRVGARKWAEAHLAMPAYLAAYEKLIRKVMRRER